MLYSFILVQRCAVLGCSNRGPHGLSTVDIESAANVGIKLKEKCRGSHLCDTHRLAVPGRHASAGASNIELAEETKAEQTAESLAYARGFSDGFEAGCKQTEEKAQPRFQPSPSYVVLVCFFLGITQSIMERYERFMGRFPPCTKRQFG